ncbi:MAG: P-loop NTPase [Thermodesulfobacteriota bacterium]
MVQHKMWAIGGGKGGVGKSVLTLALSIWLAKLGRKVIVVDADLGGANLHILLGIRYPSVTLQDFISKKADKLDDVLIDTPHENLKLICGADDMLSLANPKYTQKIRLLNQLNNLPTDFVILDLGAGTSYNVLDFFLYATGKIAVFTPQATSLQNVYGFIKSSLLRRLSREFSQNETLSSLITRFASGSGEEKISSMSELKRIVREFSEEDYLRLCRVTDSFDIKIVANMVKRDKDREASKVVRTVTEKYLDIHLTDLGFVQYDPEVERSVNRMVPFLLDNSKSQAALSIYQIAYEILRETAARSAGNEGIRPGSLHPNPASAVSLP